MNTKLCILFIIIGICYANSNESSNTNSPAISELPPNTYAFNGTKYYFNTESKLDLIDATGYCGDRSMSLVSIYSAEENDWIVNKIKELGFGSEDFWTGGIGFYSANFYKWNYRYDITFTNWASGEPSGDKAYPHSGYCIILKASTNFKWTYEVCHQFRIYPICKEGSQNQSR